MNTPNERGLITPEFLDGIREEMNSTITPLTPTAGSEYLTVDQPKKTRTRRPWVYKDQYDELKLKYDIVKRLAIFGWALAIGGPIVRFILDKI